MDNSDQTEPHDGAEHVMDRAELFQLLHLDRVSPGHAVRLMQRYVDAGKLVPLNPWNRSDRWLFSRRKVLELVNGDSG